MEGKFASIHTFNRLSNLYLIIKIYFLQKVHVHLLLGLIEFKIENWDLIWR